MQGVSTAENVENLQCRVLLVGTLQAVSVTERGSPEEILDLAFRLYDIDGNGTIEMRELAEILRVSSIILHLIHYVHA